MNRRTFIEAGSVLGGSLMAGCARRVRSRFGDEPAVEGPCEGRAQPWPTAGGDPGRTGWTETDPPVRDADSVDLLAGLRSDGRQRLASALPAVVDHMAYVPTGSELVALDLDPSENEAIWTHDAEDDVDAIPAVGCGVVLVPGLNRLTALDPATGEPYWRTEVGGHHQTTVGMAGETVYVGGAELTAVDVRTGDVKWRSDGGDTIAVGETGIFTTVNVNGTGAVFGHDRDGEERWRLALGKVVASASVTNGTVWVADTSGTIYAINAGSGETEWSRDLNWVTKIHSGIAVHGDDVVVPAGNGHKSVVLDGGTGEIRWTANTGIVTDRPIIGEEEITFGRTNRGITVYDRMTGEEQVTWSRDQYDFGTLNGLVPIENGFIVRGGTTSGLTLLQ